MAQKSLLHHIFKRGPLSTKLKKAAHRTGDDDDPLLSVEPSENTNESASSCPPQAQDVPSIELPIEVEAQQNTRRNMNSCSSSCSSCSPSTEVIHTSNIPMPITERASSPAPISVRDLLHALIEEANAATTMHMETLDTALALLNAIQGMSATVDVLKREMEEKKGVCKEMRRDLLSFEEVVREMGFVE
ncbi:hypothetical protein yc1106_01377 [Curvularia clavata]|uniref:Uncharacterized protein n=1 Tax=Curvularia clavata TaxID=95742 RepID=A0A9Q8Z547_CURCL|nr:hypothetical protein yc1106_01377 [Curvularia clavata]